MRAAPVALVVLASLVSLDPAAARPKRKNKSDLVDISASKAQLKVLADDQGRIYVIDGGYQSDSMAFFGDRRHQYRLRIFGGGANGQEYSYRFWSPRVDSQADIGRKKTGEYYVQCKDETIALQPLSDGDARAVLDKATFHTPLWKRQAHILARDEDGVYYYVDRLRDEEGGKGYRVFVGPAGAMKEQGMKNVVSDSVGEIFATKGGQLRLLTSSNETTWIKGKQKSPLTPVPVGDNVALIYGDLGVYPAGLGTPCDDQ